MSDRDALIAAILSQPDEDTPRLMFADWLDEHGDSPRAEFIRVQCALAREREAEADLPDVFSSRLSTGGRWGMNWRPHDTEERVSLLRRESELLTAHAEEWRMGLPKYADNLQTRPVVTFRRGFVGHVAVTLGQLMKAPAALWACHPVESVHLRSALGGAWRKVPTCRPLTAVRDLSVYAGRITGPLVAPLADCPHLSNLRTLSLGYADVSDDAVRASADSPHLRPISFRLNAGGLSAGPFAALLGGPFASRLRRLSPWQVPGWGAEVVAAAPLGELRLLDLSANKGGDAGVTALTKSKHLTRLVSLNLSSACVTDAALRSLAEWPGLTTVRALNLSENKSVTARGVIALVASPYFRPAYLGLRYSAVDDAGAKALAAWPGLANLIDLDLSCACLDDPGLIALADSPHWRDIRYLKVNGNRLSGGAAARIRNRLGATKVDIWG